MKTNFLILLFNCLSVLSFAQILPPVRQTYSNEISKDGKYVWTYENNSIADPGSRQYYSQFHVIIQSVNDSWKQVVNGIQGGIFTDDSKSFAYQRNDTLYSLLLGSDRTTVLSTTISDFQLVGHGEMNWLICNMSRQGDLKLLNVNSGQKIDCTDVNEWQISDNCQFLAIKQLTGIYNKRTVLKIVDLNTKSEITVSSSDTDDIKKFTFANNDRLAFIRACKKDSLAYDEIWQYDSQAKTPKMLMSDLRLQIDSGLKIAENYLQYTQHGNELLITLQKLRKPSARTGLIDLWRYTDTRIYSLQKQDEVFNRNYLAAINTKQGYLVRLEYENEILGGSRDYPPGLLGVNDDYALVCHFKGNIFAFNRDGRVNEGYSMMEYNWNKATQCTVYLVSLKDGSRTPIAKKIQTKSATFPYIGITPAGKYIIYYNQEIAAYFSYEIGTGKIKNLTKNTLVTWFKGDVPLGNADIRTYYQPCGVINFMEDDYAAIIIDHFHDIWKVDLAGSRKPQNITHGLARINKDRLNQPFADIINTKSYVQPFFSGASLLIRLSVYGQHGTGYKFDGYYKYSFKTAKLTTLLPFGGKFQYVIKDFDLDKNIFVITKNNSDNPPVSFVTQDMHNFIPLTNDEPNKLIKDAIQKKVLTWKAPDGGVCQGVLTYPMNFKAQKKYPVIVHYYEKREQTLEFQSWHDTNFTNAGWYAGPDYFYFFPDIKYKVGYTGKNALECVVSGVKLLSKMPFINNKKMGIQGASFSGYETNFIITHTNLFAAAFSGFGVSDFLSGFGNDEHDSQDLVQNGMIEVGQWRIGVTPWNRPDIYLANSPIIYANRITTPLLIAHYYTDTRCPFVQSVELFKALRRLGKPVWMFASDPGPAEGFHGGDPPKGASMAFFNYYLNNGPEPDWMFGDMAEPTQMDANAKPVFSKQRGKFASGLKYKHEITTPQQKELLREPTRVNDNGYVEKR